MQQNDDRFFEEYKHLEKLCSEIFGCTNGVSEYIRLMEEHSGQFCVPTWDSDYKMLKHIRWVRNQIAHEFSADSVSEPGDTEFTQEFYRRILSGQDPLTLYRKKREAKRVSPKPQAVAAHSTLSIAEKKANPKADKKTFGWTELLIVFLIAAVILFFLYYHA